MGTVILVLAYTISGIVGFVGGGVIVIVLFNLLHYERRARNLIAWRVFMGQRGHGEVFVIKDKALAAKFWAVLDGKLFFHHGPGRKADRKKREAQNDSKKD